MNVYHPIAGNIHHMLSPLRTEEKRIVKVIDYLAQKSGKKVVRDSVTSGPADHHRPNNTFAEIFELKDVSFVQKIRQKFAKREIPPEKPINKLIRQSNKK